MRYGMVIDLNTCVGCDTCTIACKAYNYTLPGVYWARVLEKEIGKYPTVKRLFLPVLCNHCKIPPCQHVCPTGATIKRDDGIVLVDYDKCIGCRACAMACPYGARNYIHKKDGYFPDHGQKSFYRYVGFTLNEKMGYKSQQEGVSTKCTFCFDRVAKGRSPACVEACPTECRVFGDLDDPTSEVSQLINTRSGYQLRSEQGTDPSVFYVA